MHGLDRFAPFVHRQSFPTMLTDLFPNLFQLQAQEHLKLWLVLTMCIK